jgi:hypothetical protein
MFLTKFSGGNHFSSKKNNMNFAMYHANNEKTTLLYTATVFDHGFEELWPFFSSIFFPRLWPNSS